jgi:hypothetical protein
MADGETAAKPPKAVKKTVGEQVEARPLPGLGGDLPQGTEADSLRADVSRLRQENDQLRNMLQQEEAKSSKAVRIIGKLKEKIGDIEVQWQECMMDRDDHLSNLRALAAQMQAQQSATKNPEPPTAA